MSVHTKQPFRADHVVSIRRPDKLMKSREKLLGAHDLDHNFGPHQNSELRAIEDKCVREVVKLQEDVGLHM
jgi:5-methyltetrahydropteroyltriglutamate--homocysteine methyltransferase